MNGKLKSRLYNWKFETALNYIDGNTSVEVRHLTEALARMYGNCGWFSGDAGFVVGMALQAIGVTEER